MANLDAATSTILNSDLSLTDKLSYLVKMGYEDEVASRLVEQHEAGVQLPVYYESLDDQATN